MAQMGRPAVYQTAVLCVFLTVHTLLMTVLEAVFTRQVIKNSTQTVLPPLESAVDGAPADNSSVSSVLPQSPAFNVTQADGTLTNINPGALLRGSIVFGVLCILVVAYIAFRTCRLHRNRKTARYNVLSTRDESAPLHSDGEEGEEETVFDAAGARR